MRRYEHGGDIYRNNIRIDLSKSINPMGMPQNVKEALIGGVDSFSEYPDPYCESLRNHIAAREGVSAGEIICGNGATELIRAVCRAVNPKTGRVFRPTFSEYETAIKLAGGGLTEKDSDITFICTPNNPTGALTPIQNLEILAAQSRLLVMDECFIDFTRGASFVPLLKEYGNVIVLKAFTKIYALAGLRLGYAITENQALLEGIRAQIPCWNVSVPAQLAGIAALLNTGWEEKTRKIVLQEREFLIASMRKYVKAFDSDANFIFFETDKPVYDFMLSHGILVRRWSEKQYRIAVSGRENNEEFLKWLSRL